MAQVAGVVLVEGMEPPMGVPVGSDPMSKKLAELNLSQYAKGLMEDQGYDDMDSLQGLSVEELTQIANDVSMKPGHKKKFIAAFKPEDAVVSNRASSNSVAERSAAAPVSPQPTVESAVAVELSVLEMQKELAEMKKKQDADRTRREFEEKEQQLKEKLEAEREANRKEAEMRKTESEAKFVDTPMT